MIDLDWIVRGLAVLSALILRATSDRAVRARGLGDALLVDALKRVAGLTEEIGIRAVVVYALDDEAAYYLHKVFEPFADNPRHLFMAMPVIRMVTGTVV